VFTRDDIDRPAQLKQRGTAALRVRSAPFHG
jgi:hypothetical protein